MCDRFTLNIPPEVLVKIFELTEFPQYEPRYNIAPSQKIASIRRIGDRNKLAFLKWDLIPSWSADASCVRVDARSEAIHDKPEFEHAVKYNRCIIPASGFYEWLPGEYHNQPYYIRFSTSGLMAFAGLWERWKTVDGSELESCCILTTAANEIMKPIHDRMPVILSPEDYGRWLNPDLQDTNELKRLYLPFPADHMVAHPVPELVNNPRFDSASCIVQV